MNLNERDEFNCLAFTRIKRKFQTKVKIVLNYNNELRLIKVLLYVLLDLSVLKAKKLSTYFDHECNDELSVLSYNIIQ